jgi:hypothetical protein
MKEKKVLNLASSKEEVKDSVKKLSYEELENVAKQLSAQGEELYKRLLKAEEMLAIRRLDYLIKIVELKDCFSKSFIEECVKEIENSLSIPEEKTKE